MARREVPQRWAWIYGENGEVVATDPGARVNRQHTASRLNQLNPLLLDGQMVQERDTGALKVGDGNSRWQDLPYFVGAVAGLSDEQLSEALDAKGLLTQADADAAYAPQIGGIYVANSHGLKGDWTGGDANTGTGTNDTAALLALIDAIPDGSTILFSPASTYRLDPMEIVGRSLTLDFQGAHIITKLMDGVDFATATPFISWSSEVTAPYNTSSAGVARGGIEVVTNPYSLSNDFVQDEYVIVRDHKPVAKWDTDVNVSWVGRGEINIVRSISPSSGIVRMQVPLSHDYEPHFSNYPTMRRILTPATPIIRNIGRISDTNPGGEYTGDVETTGAHLFYFYGCIDPLVQNVAANGWQNQITAFNSCLRPISDNVRGRNPFQVGGGHGYGGRMVHCVDGEFYRSEMYGVRHVVNYVGSARCGSRECKSFVPAGVSYQTHGLRSRDIYSIDDTVIGGNGAGWAHGNDSFRADFGYRIVRPRYYGENRAIVARSRSTGMRIEDPEIHTSDTGIAVSGAAGDVVIDLRQGLVEIFGSDADAYAVQAFDGTGTGTFKPGDVTVRGPGSLVGTRALVSLDVDGAARVDGFEYDQGDSQVLHWDGSAWVEVEGGGGVTLDTDQTITGAKSMSRVGFFGTSALAVKPSATDDLGTVLSALGLRTAGTAYPITTSGAVALTGGVRTSVATRTANHTVTVTNPPHCLVDATSGNITITLPNTGSAGHRFLIKKIDGSANTVAVVSASIDGASSVILDAQYEWVEVVSTFTVGIWFIVGRG
ncbi:tail spike protein [Gordonia phage Turuncu]|uniref:Minor tail protein n=1 Tax=Gordonia phage Turuncu TaxID=2315610 RepID=A0A386K9N3_9CAUD|nr:tail spike protein [Gordonia phage Turuncu]AYD82111.1 hypothetical protein SEA_TURUNCU_24 [Gordonia phage Turuncu]